MSLLGEKQFHILYLIDELILKGGTESHLFDLAKGMAEKGHRITVMCLAEGEFAKSFQKIPGVLYECLNIVRIYDGRGIAAIVRISSYIKRNKVDILQTFHTASDLIGPIAAKLACVGVKMISSRRDLGYTKSHRHVQAQRIINKLIHGILANSEAVKSVVINQERFPEERINVIHNGIHVGRFANPVPEKKQALIERLCVSGDQFVVGSVGNLRPVKGYRFMVEAAALLCPRYPKLMFLVAGEGEIKEELERLCVDLGVEKQFRFVGKVKEIPEFLSCLNLYVQPSLSEGFSNAILEAMAAGLAVVATSVGGNQEIIEEGKNGLFAKAGDSKSLAETVEFLLRDPCGCRTMSVYSRERTIMEFSIGAMINSYSEFYEMLNNGKKCFEERNGFK